MIPAGFTLVALYLFPFSPDITIILGVALIVVGYARGWKRERQAAETGGNRG